jgi:hypothetical protein
MEKICCKEIEHSKNNFRVFNTLFIYGSFYNSVSFSPALFL